MAGKGSKYRSVDRNKFNNNWDRIFSNVGTNHNGRNQRGDEAQGEGDVSFGDVPLNGRKRKEA